MSAVAEPGEILQKDNNATDSASPSCRKEDVVYRQYTGEEDLPTVMGLVDNELSEPYSIFTYRFFVQNWPKLCWLAYNGDQCFGVVVCKLEPHRDLLRGYVGMLVVLPEYRGLGVGTELVRKCIQQMRDDKADEVVLECEVTNKGGLALYQNLGFIRDKRLVRYYLSGNDAFRLKLMLPLHPDRVEEMQQQAQSAVQPGQMANHASVEQNPIVSDGLSDLSIEGTASLRGDPSRSNGSGTDNLMNSSNSPRSGVNGIDCKSKIGKGLSGSQSGNPVLGEEEIRQSNAQTSIGKGLSGGLGKSKKQGKKAGKKK